MINTEETVVNALSFESDEKKMNSIIQQPLIVLVFILIFLYVLNIVTRQKFHRDESHVKCVSEAKTKNELSNFNSEKLDYFLSRFHKNGKDKNKKYR